MPTKKDNCDSLRKLRDFCARPPRGMCAHWWFNGLVNAFPMHFLYYTQFASGFQGTKKNAREKILSSLRSKMEELLKYPVTEQDIAAFERIIQELDDLAGTKRSASSN